MRVLEVGVPGRRRAPPACAGWRRGRCGSSRGTSGRGGAAGAGTGCAPPPGLPPPRERLVLRDTSLRWQLFGGRDFGAGHAPAAARPRRGGHAPSGHTHWRSRGGPGRRQDLLMELHLGKVSVQHETYDEEAAEGQPWGGRGAGEGPGQRPGGSRGAAVGPGERPTARLVLLVQELELRDRLGGDGAPPFLSRHPRGGPPPQPPTLWVKALRVLPHPPPPGGVPECCLRVALAPLRLHIDQDALLFLRDYISSFIAHMDPPAPPPDPPHGSGAPPGLEPLEEEEPETESPVYFREFRFTAEVPLWLDYHGKRVTMEQGALAGILIGLAQLNCCHLRLRRLCHRHGLLGLSRVLSFAVSEWLRDIRCHQLPGLLGGVAPVHAVLRLWRALRDLLLLPLLGTPAGGVTRGVTRGVTALGAASASAAISLCSRLLRALQALAEALYELVAPPGPPRALEAPPEPSGDHQQPLPCRRARPRPQ
ncbi:autophagy-related protein 2 homolog A-like [Strigops habroptila]|uniref:autophagy-related protein 2 homolog A-like n=1 Tax=Strigops habroptila TaxID=2489341 RepID=UPI0011D025FD|nr:autophagy-related protein 2 homolog A-like [Strigops habroptila]